MAEINHSEEFLIFKHYFSEDSKDQSWHIKNKTMSSNSWRRKAIAMYNTAVESGNLNDRAGAVLLLGKSGGLDFHQEPRAALQLIKITIATAKRMPTYAASAPLITLAKAQLEALPLVDAVAASLRFKLACVDASKGLVVSSLHAAEDLLKTHSLDDSEALELASIATEVGIAYTEQRHHLKALEAIEIAVSISRKYNAPAKAMVRMMCPSHENSLNQQR